MDSSVIIKVVSLMKKAGIEILFQDSVEGDGHDLTPEDVVKLIQDKTKFLTDYYGVSKGQLISYINFQESGGQCTALTTKNLQCSIRAEGSSVKDFIYGETTLCTRHKNYILKSKNVR
jgi:hypothetical protein